MWEYWIGMGLGIVMGNLIWRKIMSKWRPETTVTKVTHIILEGRTIKLDYPLTFTTTH